MSTVIDATKVFERRQQWDNLQRYAEQNCEEAARIHRVTEDRLAQAYALLRAVEAKRAEEDREWMRPSDCEAPFQ